MSKSITFSVTIIGDAETLSEMFDKAHDVANAYGINHPLEAAWNGLSLSLLDAEARERFQYADERTGLECPDCGRKQMRMNIERAPKGLMIRIATIASDDSELKGIISMLCGFLGGGR